MTVSASPKVIRERLSRIGKSAADVARELGVSQFVAAGVIAGRLSGERGDAHKVAVALGMKDGVIVEEGASIAEALKAVA